MKIFSVSLCVTAAVCVAANACIAASAGQDQDQDQQDTKTQLINVHYSWIQAATSEERVIKNDGLANTISELSYRAQITPGFAVGDGTREGALVALGVRYRVVAGTMALLELSKKAVVETNEDLLKIRPIFTADVLAQYRKELS
ncbi:hypothetical protein CPC16_008038 [Podila verticillata]|nr:hypothetical protein CPC16_008038 [Podila verticillata]